MSDTSLKAYYARRAPEYDAIYRRPERQVSLASLKNHVRGYFEDRHVLELACGTGYWTDVIASHAKTIHAVDINNEVLAIARRRLGEKRGVTFEQADVYDLAHVSTNHDAGLAAFWYSHIPRRHVFSFLDQFHAKLKAGSRVCFIDNNFVEGSSTPISETDDEGNTYQIRRLKDGSVYRVMKNFPNLREWELNLKGRGENLNIQQFTYYWALTYNVTH